MAVLMGGPRLRPAIDQALHALQQADHLHPHHQPASQQPPSKRQRTQAPGRASSPPAAAEDGAGGSSPQHAANGAQLPDGSAPAANAMALPPGSFGPQGRRIAVQHAPALEAFLVEHLLPEEPVVLAGKCSSCSCISADIGACPACDAAGVAQVQSTQGIIQVDAAPCSRRACLRRMPPGACA